MHGDFLCLVALAEDVDAGGEAFGRCCNPHAAQCVDIAGLVVVNICLHIFYSIEFISVNAEEIPPWINLPAFIDRLCRNIESGLSIYSLVESIPITLNGILS